MTGPPFKVRLSLQPSADELHSSRWVEAGFRFPEYGSDDGLGARRVALDLGKAARKGGEAKEGQPDEWAELVYSASFAPMVGASGRDRGGGAIAKRSRSDP